MAARELLMLQPTNDARALASISRSAVPVRRVPWNRSIRSAQFHTRDMYMNYAPA
jgi:hypothetical protein